MISLFFCVAAMVGVSLSTPPPAPAQLDGLTYASAMAGIVAAETELKAVGDTADAPAPAADAGAPPAAEGPGAASAWEQANAFGSENFDALNKYGSAGVVGLLAIMLVSFA